MDTLEDRIIAEARTWLGTPWHHNQSCKGAGVDCVRFAIACCESQGVEVGKIQDYYRTPRGNSLLDGLDSLPSTKQIHDFTDEDIVKGRLLLFKIRSVPHHIGFCSDPGMLIHADMRSGKVVEHHLGAWRRKLVAVFEIVKGE